MLYSLIFTFSHQQHTTNKCFVQYETFMWKWFCLCSSLLLVYVFVKVFLCSNSRPYSLTSSLCINRILKYTLYIKNTRDSNDDNSSTSSTTANDNDNSAINSVYRSESHSKWYQCIWFMENLGHTQPRRDNNDHRAYTVWLNKNVASLHFYLLSTSSKLLLLSNESKIGAGWDEK